jgi:hypothetical protein
MVTPMSPTVTAMATIEPVATWTPIPVPSETPNACELVWANGSWYDREIGYCWLGTHWVPGLLTNRAIWMHMPSHVWGYSAAYAAGVMPSPGPGYVGGISVPFCIEVGTDVWLRHADQDWEGPFLVVDCSRPVGLYTHVVDDGLVVEVDNQTYQRWGGLGVVVLSKSPPPVNEKAVYIRDWFLSQNPFGIGQ